MRPKARRPGLASSALGRCSCGDIYCVVEHTGFTTADLLALAAAVEDITARCCSRSTRVQAALGMAGADRRRRARA
jgi:hypothetical protein